MSDLGKLFGLCVSGPKPLENFATAALAIAIGRDDRPMKQALGSVDSNCQGADIHSALETFRTAASETVSVTAATQKTLWPTNDAGLCYLDLVLTVRGPQQPDSTIWVEVKVDAWESGDQLAVYKRHAALLLPSPAIITLGRMQVKSDVPFLRWSDVFDAIPLIPDTHHAWLDLREFLLEQKIVYPPLVSEPIDAAACINVIVDINGRIRELWSSPGTGLGWSSNAALGKSLTRGLAEQHHLVTTGGGPLCYGLRPAGNRWEWHLGVGTDNYQHVQLDREQMLRDADVGGLPTDWLRLADGVEVLERRTCAATLTSHDEIVSWFDVGIRQLREAKILDRYIAAVARKQAHAAYAVPDN